MHPLEKLAKKVQKKIDAEIDQSVAEAKRQGRRQAAGRIGRSGVEMGVLGAGTALGGRALGLWPSSLRHTLGLGALFGTGSAALTATRELPQLRRHNKLLDHKSDYMKQYSRAIRGKNIQN